MTKQASSGDDGRRIGLPCANVELATGGPGAENALGVISQSVFGGNESLIHGNLLLADIGIVGDDSHDRTGYTVAAVRAALDQVGPAVEAEGASAWETFVGYLVLDVLIGNTDRLQESQLSRAAGSPSLMRRTTLAVTGAAWGSAPWM